STTCSRAYPPSTSPRCNAASRPPAGHPNACCAEATSVRSRATSLPWSDRPGASSSGAGPPGGSTVQPADLPCTDCGATDAKVLARVEAPTGPIRVLDVGCADGTILDWYKASGHGGRIETHGIDFNQRAAEVARGRGHRVVVGRFEEEDELERDAFHLILAS